MSIASLADISRGPRALPADAATSRLDRVLAPLADLGNAIRDEIAVSLMPMAAELETARTLVSTLEVRVHDLEARLAATTVEVFDPDLPASAPRRAVEKPPVPTPERAETPVASRPVGDGEVANGGPNHAESAAATETQGSVAATTGTASRGPEAHDPSPSPAATVAAAGPQTEAEAPTRKRKPRNAALPKGAAVAPAPAVTITIVLAPGVSAPAAPVSVVLMPPQMDAATVSVAVAVAAAMPAAPVLDTPNASVSEPSRPAPAADEFAEPAPAASGASCSTEIPDDDTREGMWPGARVATARDPAAGLLHPLLERGAREMIALGHYPDVAALLNDAIFRLLESDYPADPGG